MVYWGVYMYSYQGKEYKIFITNGYPSIYLPTHPLSNKIGVVYIHRLQAEILLGRPLSKKEAVHHIDEDRSNYSFDNLMVFATNSDHARFHSGYPIYKSEGVYYSSPKPQNRCNICGIPTITINAFYCVDCLNKWRARNIPSKEQLEQDIIDLNSNMCAIGRKYGVSDNAVRKWLRKYNIAR